MFLLLTDRTNNEPCLINVDDIQDIRMFNGMARIYTHSRDEFPVTATVVQIAETLKRNGVAVVRPQLRKKRNG